MPVGQRPRTPRTGQGRTRQGRTGPSYAARHNVCEKVIHESGAALHTRSRPPATVTDSTERQETAELKDAERGEGEGGQRTHEHTRTRSHLPPRNNMRFYGFGLIAALAWRSVCRSTTSGQESVAPLGEKDTGDFKSKRRPPKCAHTRIQPHGRIGTLATIVCQLRRDKCPREAPGFPRRRRSSGPPSPGTSKPRSRPHGRHANLARMNCQRDFIPKDKSHFKKEREKRNRKKKRKRIDW